MGEDFESFEGHEGYEWATEAVYEWVVSDRVLRGALLDVIHLHAGSNCAFWMAEFLFRARAGEVPFVNQGNLRKRMRGDLGSASMPNFEHVNFKEIATRLLVETTPAGEEN
jgi:hypothetical protein